MKYHRVVTIGDTAQDQVQWFCKSNVDPLTRLRALEIVNRWNKQAAENVARFGYTATPIFYYLGEDA